MKHILSSIIRFGYQPGDEMMRVVAMNLPWKPILAVLVVSGFITMADPSLYTADSFIEDTIVNILFVGPVFSVVVSFIMAYITRWLFSISGYQTTLKDNVIIGAWSGAVASALILPSVWLAQYIGEASAWCTGGVVVYSLALMVGAYRRLTSASWLHILGVFIASGFVVLILGFVMMVVFALVGVLPE